MTTGRDIVYQALYKSGITGRGISPSAADTTDALADLNDMLDQWRLDNVKVWDKLSSGFTGDGRTTFYTVGPGGDYNLNPRPNRIYSAFVRQLQNVGNLTVDTPLKVLDAREEYDRINTKDLASFPELVFMDTSMPQAKLYIYPWPSPAGQYAVYITTKGSIPVVALNTVIEGSFPQGYVAAMKFNLARRLRQSHGRGMKPDPELNRLANDALDVIMAGNLQVPEVGMPSSLLTRGSGYNIYSDQFGN